MNAGAAARITQRAAVRTAASSAKTAVSVRSSSTFVRKAFASVSARPFGPIVTAPLSAACRAASVVWVAMQIPLGRSV